MAHAKGFSLDTYTDVVMARSPIFVDRLKGMGDAIAKREHEVTQASIERWAAGFEGSLSACQEMGIDDALPAAIKHNFDRALAAGYGDKELTAVFEVLIGAKGDWRRLSTSLRSEPVILFPNGGRSIQPGTASPYAMQKDLSNLWEEASQSIFRTLLQERSEKGSKDILT